VPATVNVHVNEVVLRGRICDAADGTGPLTYVDAAVPSLQSCDPQALVGVTLVTVVEPWFVTCIVTVTVSPVRMTAGTTDITAVKLPMETVPLDMVAEVTVDPFDALPLK